MYVDRQKHDNTTQARAHSPQATPSTLVEGEYQESGHPLPPFPSLSPVDNFNYKYTGKKTI